MSFLDLYLSYISLVFTPILKKGSGGNNVGLFLELITLISALFSLLALSAICSPNKVPTPIPEPL